MVSLQAPIFYCLAPILHLHDCRAFWWDGSAEVILSEKMEQWLADLARRHKQIMEEMVLINWDKEEFLKKFV